MLPKSLHTVSVLVNVARFAASVHPLPIPNAVEYAADLLGYGADVPDVYALKAAAVRKLEKASAPAPAAKRSAAPQPGSCMAIVMDALRS